MEGIFFNTSSAEVQNETASFKVEKEVFMDSNIILPQKENTSVEKNGNIKKQEETKQEANGHIENGPETPSSGDSTNANESVTQKSYSPTLIGTAIKAMKNLFSPDKPKAKPVSALSPINQQKNASGSPCSSIYVPTIISPEAEVEVLNNVNSAPEENNLKNQLQTELGRSQSPLTMEHHNNTDESFLTTVSLIDDSFHSAVTHLDEHAEALKVGAHLMENFLNNSQNLDLLDPYNDTLENNESYLDNTTVKVGNTSILNGDENSENLNHTQDIGFFNKITHSNGCEKVHEKVLNENVQNIISHEAKNSKDEGLGNEQHSSASTAAVHCEVEESKTTERVEMAHLFLNKSFQEEIQKNGVQGNNEVIIKESEIEFGCEKDEEEDYVDNCISTTTIVLNSDDSSEVDKMLKSLKAGDSEDYAPSLTSLEGSDDVTSSVENMLQKLPIYAAGRVLPYKQSADSSSSPATNFSPQLQEKKCVGEGNSQNHGQNSTKIKVNKSDELINRRIPSDPQEGKRGLQDKKSSVDISLMKNSEASEVSKGLHPFSKVTETFEEHQHQTDEGDLPFDKPEAVTVVSQKSYTILNHDKKLNRPVIQSVNTSKDLSDMQTFQVIPSDASVPIENSERSLVKNCGNTPLNAEDLMKSSKLKQSTPLMEGNNDSTQKFFRPTALKFTSLDSPETQNTHGGVEEQKENLSNHSNPELLDESIQIFSSNQMSMEISPVNPVNDYQFSNSVERETERNHIFVSFEQNATKVLLPEESSQIDPKSKPFENSNETPQTVHQLNQTFEKKQPTPKHKIDKSPESTGTKPNQTYRKTSASPGKSRGKHNKFNETFDKNLSKSKNHNSTFTKKRESLEENKTFLKPASPEPALMNQTYDKKQNEISDKKTFTSLVDKTHIIEKTLESARNQTFIKEDSEKNKTYEITQEAKENGVIKNVELINNSKNESYSSEKSSGASLLSTVVLNGEDLGGNETFEELSEKLGKLELNAGVQAGFDESDPGLPENVSFDGQAEEKLLNSLKDDKLPCDPDLVQLIQEQFSPNDIEKICNVVQDMSSVKLSNDILRASVQFDKSFHGNISDVEFKPPEAVLKLEKPIDSLSPHNFDFLNSIRGKPTGRDLSRESLYVKFDPLVQPSVNSLIDFTKEGEALPPIEPSPPGSHNTSICEQLLAISPQKKPGDIVPPLTPLSSKSKKEEDKSERLKELQNEIYFLKNLYAEREKSNRAKMEDYESQITKLTGESCFLENKLKESNDRERALVKKVKEQNQSIKQLKMIMEEYLKVISKLTTELEALKSENKKQIETLSSEKDSYMTHLQNTEAAFSDVHTKYEKSKKTIVSLKANEAMYRNTITEQAQKLEEFKQKAKEAQDKALLEFQKVQEELSETKSSHTQEIARLRAQLRKTELKVEALQESLDQKMKENQQLTAICDELIEGKK